MLKRISVLFLSLCVSGHALTLEEKVGQLIVTGFQTEAKELVFELKVGGIVLFKGNNTLADPQQVARLCSDLQAMAEIPLLIGIDQEGGRVAHLTEGFTPFPAPAAIGRTGDPALAYQAAYAVGRELKAVGINLNFAPVVDVNDNPDNPIIGSRSFGPDPKQVAQFGEAYTRGLLDAGILPCLKHFPGHGNTSTDSHYRMPVVRKTPSALEETEFYPFRTLAPLSPLIMTSHILFPTLDPNHSATLSPTLLQGILRDAWAYQGVIVSDSLTMKGAGEEIGEVAVQAFLAGCDLLLCGDIEPGHLERARRVHTALLEAVQSGRISPERLEASLNRILILKEQLSPQATLAKEIAYRSVFPAKIDWSCPVESQRVAIVCPERLAPLVATTDLVRLGHTNQFIPWSTSVEQLEEEIAETGATYLIVCTDHPSQLPLLNTLSSRWSTAWVSSGTGEDLDGPSEPLIKIATYGPSVPSFQVAAEWIRGSGTPLQLSHTQAQQLGERVWENECGRQTDLLCFWNARETFPSLGIGHFTYRHGGEFPRFLEWLEERQIAIPDALTPDCPWPNREAFYREAPPILLPFLQRTIPEQALYMAQRLDQALFSITLAANPKERPRLINRFFEVARAPDGFYTLLDYLNFKGDGTRLAERYQGQGWGLLQVLLRMEDEGGFAQAASALLRERIANSPRPELEEHWLPGWLKRVQTYETKMGREQSPLPGG